MNITDIKPGMKLKVIEGQGSLLPKDSIVTVDGVEQGRFVYIKEAPSRMGNGWCPYRFAPAVEFKRDNKGRFLSEKSGPVRLTPPGGLKVGSLYAVKRKRGVDIARLKYQFDDNVVMVIHKKPFLAKKSQVKLATHTEVQQYLSK